MRMHRLKHIAVVTALGLVALPACSRTHPDSHDVNERVDAPERPVSATEDPGPGPGLRRLVELAKTDLSAKLQIDAGDIETVEAAFVTWRDSSIGCPTVGMQYMQVLTNGARMVLRANGVLYHYHSGGDRAPFLCARPSPEGPLPYGPGEA